MTSTKDKPAAAAIKDLLSQSPDGLREIVRAVMRIPAQSGQVFRFEAGQHSGMKPDTVPINCRTLSPL